MLGFQILSVAVFAKVFAISEGLLPPDRKVEKFFSYANLENGLLAGALIFLVGVGLSLYAFVSWHAHHFGRLNVAQMLRLTLPAAAAMTLGVQISVSSFFLGLLRLGKR